MCVMTRLIILIKVINQITTHALLSFLSFFIIRKIELPIKIRDNKNKFDI